MTPAAAAGNLRFRRTRETTPLSDQEQPFCALSGALSAEQTKRLTCETSTAPPQHGAYAPKFPLQACGHGNRHVLVDIEQACTSATRTVTTDLFTRL